MKILKHSTQKCGHDNVGLLLTISSWMLTGATAFFSKGNISFCLSTIVSLMAIRHYYLQNKKSK
jgi:hypothetical protein